MRYRFGTTVLDTGTQQLLRDGDEVAVEPQVFAVLVLLVEERARVVSKEELLDRIWGDRFVSESALTTRIKQARQAVGDSGREQRIIRTVHGRGFRFVAEVDDGSGPAGTAAAPVPPAEAAVDSRAGEWGIPRTHWADAEGAAIAYQTYGEGPDLVFVAGFATNLEVQWEHPGIAAFLRRLGALARVTVLDKRGVGLSDRIPTERPPSLETRADDLRAVMDRAGVERASFLGSSEGGSLAVLMAASHPERVEKLLLHNTWGRNGWLRANGPDLDRVARGWGTGGLMGALGPGLASDEEGRRVLAKLERQSATPGTARMLIELITRIDITDTLGSVATPTTVLHRVDDPIVEFDQGRILADGIPGARLVPLAGSDHWIFSGDTTELFDEIGRALGDRTPAPALSDRILATVLFVDMTDSTATAARLGDSRWAQLLARFYGAAREVVEAHRGELLKTTGDGFMAVFDGPGRAVTAACRLRALTTDLGVVLRAGVHTAEVERIEGDVCGIGVNLASRIADLAGPGTVWVSRTVTDLVAGTGLRFLDRGVHELKGIDRPWALYEVDA